MKNSENRKFEEEWSQAFEGAEVTPSANVWASIDSQLLQAESGNMRKRVVFYQRLAAAAVFFALCIGASGVWYLSEEREIGQLVNVTEQSKVNATTKYENQNGQSEIEVNNTASSNPIKGTNQIDGNSISKSNSTNGEVNSTKWKPENSGNKTILLADDKSTASVSQEVETEPKWYDVTLAKKMDFLSTLKVKGKPIEQIASARKFKEVPKDNKKDKAEGWWASVNGSGGVYSQTSTSNSIASTAFQLGSNVNLRTPPVSSAANVGTSYSYGVSVGKKVAKRLVVMMGINYLNHSIDYSSNIILQNSNQSRVFLSEIATQSSDIATTSPYTIKNTNEFVSLPLQAGYLILDRKAGIQLNAGMAADLFYRNTIADQSGQVSSYSQGAGDNSVYRTVNWTGLIGTELSYKMNNHYHISLVPGVRYSFDSVLKSSTGSAINPLIWDVGFRFKYIF